MSMRYYASIFLIFGVILITSCSGSKKPDPAHLRAVSMVPNAEVAMTIQPAKKAAAKQPSLLNDTYRSFQSGRYLLKAEVNNRVIFKRTYVLGKGAYYTMALSGLMPQHPDSVSDTWKYRLTNIFAGAEARVANNYLPIGFILYDSYFGNQSQAILRITNSAPFAPKITVKAGKKALAKKLHYPESSHIIYVKPGTKKLHVYYGSIERATKTIKTKAGYMYNIFVSNKKNALPLQITVLRNPTKALKTSSGP